MSFIEFEYGGPGDASPLRDLMQHPQPQLFPDCQFVQGKRVIESEVVQRVVAAGGAAVAGPMCVFKSSTCLSVFIARSLAANVAHSQYGT
jgi:hypothetical protein